MPDFQLTAYEIKRYMMLGVVEEIYPQNSIFSRKEVGEIEKDEFLNSNKKEQLLKNNKTKMRTGGVSQ